MNNWCDSFASTTTEDTSLQVKLNSSHPRFRSLLVNNLPEEIKPRPNIIILIRMPQYNNTDNNAGIFEIKIHFFLHQIPSAWVRKTRIHIVLNTIMIKNLWIASMLKRWLLIIGIVQHAWRYYAKRKSSFWRS